MQVSATTPISRPAAEERVCRLVCEILSRTARRMPFTVTDTLAHVGLVSVEMISLMLAVEREFDVEIPHGEITPETFRSVSSIAALVSRLAPERARLSDAAQL